MSVTPPFRRRLVVGFALVVVLFSVHASLRWTIGRYTTILAACDQPCKSSDPSCSRMELSLELKDARARAGKIPRIWYRASVTNPSCDSYEVKADFFNRGKFSEIDQYERTNFHFRVWNDKGLELETPLGYFTDGPGGFHVTSSIKPAASYEVLVVDGSNQDPGAFERLLRYRDTNAPADKDADASLAGVEPYAVDDESYPEIFEKMSDTDSISLEAGRTIPSKPTKYWPNRMEVFQVNTDQHAGSGVGRFPVKLKQRIAPEPPPGFRLLDRLVFFRPGRYKIRLAYKQKVIPWTRLRYESLPYPAIRFLEKTGKLLGVRAYKPVWDGSIDAQSLPIEITVTP